jgi:hypothetical protein
MAVNISGSRYPVQIVNGMFIEFGACALKPEALSNNGTAADAHLSGPYIFHVVGAPLMPCVRWLSFTNLPCLESDLPFKLST